jgi:hypothetical protein
MRLVLAILEIVRQGFAERTKCSREPAYMYFNPDKMTSSIESDESMYDHTE